MLTAETTVRQIGNSNGMILDKLVCESLGLSLGDKLSLYVGDGFVTFMPKGTQKKPRFGIAKGKLLADEELFSTAIEEETAALFGVGA